MSYNESNQNVTPFNSTLGSGNIFTDGEIFDDYNPQQAMWRAVITQALMDAASNSRKKVYINNKAKAIAWLFNDSEDFNEVCENAGYDPRTIRKKAAIAFRNNFQWRLPAGKGAKYNKNRGKKTLEKRIGAAPVSSKIRKTA